MRNNYVSMQLKIYNFLIIYIPRTQPLDTELIIPRFSLRVVYIGIINIQLGMSDCSTYVVSPFD